MYILQNKNCLTELSDILETRKKADMQCVHIDKVNPKIQGNTKGCEECEKIGSRWVHLRLCLTCV